MNSHSPLTIRAEQMPVAMTPMVGRTAETATLIDLLNGSTTRLVTITGPSGVGKTRLALHVATSIGEQSSLQPIFISLGLLRIPELVMQAIGTTMGVYSQSTGDDYEELLLRELAGIKAFLVLDNLEQVLEVGPILSRLLQAAPDIQILATSQAPLGIKEETVMPLSTLDTPTVNESSVETILESSAVRLFIERARGVNPQFRTDTQEQVIADLCRALDGLPLAIELAAARTNIFTPQAMLARLSNRLDILSSESIDLPPRQRTMRAAVGWSYDLLASEEQFLFRRLSTFAGGFTIEAVEIIAPESGSNRSPYDLLGVLVNHSLVQAVAREDSEARYFMLETVRKYGLEQLGLRDELHTARLQHAEIMALLAEHVEPGIIGPDQEVWMRRLDDSIDNIRLAIAWSLENGHQEIALRICGATWRYLSTRGLARYGLQWIQQALNYTGENAPNLRGKGLLAGGFLALDLRDWITAQTMLEQARYLSAAIGAQAMEARALIGLGSIASDKADYDTAERFQQQAAELARKTADKRSLAIALGNLASLGFLRGQLEQAVAFATESIDLMQELGDMAAVALASNNLGAMYIEMGEWELAETCLLRALERQRRISDVRDIPYTLVNLGEVARQLGDYTLAYDSMTEAALIARQTGFTVLEGYALSGLANLALTQRDITQAAEYLRECLQRVSGANEAMVVLECLHQMVRICAAQGNHATVVELMAADVSIRERLNMPKSARMQSELAPLLETATAILPVVEIETSRAAGASMDIEDVSRRLLILARRVAGRQQPTSTLPAVPVSEPATHNLTPREIEILQLLAQGNSTQQIADTLFISPRTIATHVTSILGKLGVQNRTAAVAWALRVGIA